MTSPIGPRLNAMQHGLYATDELFLAHLKRRERTIFRKHRDSLREYYNPQTDPEIALVDRIAIQFFRLYRLYSIEYRAGNLSLRDPLDPKSILPHLDRIARFDSRIQSELRTLQRELIRHFIARGNLAHNKLPYMT